MSGNRLFGSVVEHWIIEIFFSLNCYALFSVTAFIRKMGACPGLDLIPHRNGLILCQNGVFQVIINDDFMMTSLKRGSVTADNSTLRIAYTCRFISNF